MVESAKAMTLLSEWSPLPERSADKESEHRIQLEVGAEARYKCREL